MFQPTEQQWDDAYHEALGAGISLTPDELDQAEAHVRSNDETLDRIFECEKRCEILAESLNKYGSTPFKSFQGDDSSLLSLPDGVCWRTEFEEVIFEIGIKDAFLYVSAWKKLVSQDSPIVRMYNPRNVRNNKRVVTIFRDLLT